MSESSEGYHLHDRGPAARRLLEAAGVQGLLLATSGGWVTLLVAPGDAQELAARSAGLLLHQSFSEDYGLWLQVMDGGAEVGTLTFTWHPGIEADIPNPVVGALRSHGVLPAGGEEKLAALARAHLDGALEAEDLRERLCKLVGIPVLQWLRGDHLEEKLPEIKERYPRASLITPKQRRTTAAPVPNQWCDLPDQPAYMYLPVPVVDIRPEHRAMAERHLEWFDAQTDERCFRILGLWGKQLDRDARHLSDRVVQCDVLRHNTGDARWSAERLRTVATILALTWNKTDWEKATRRLEAGGR